MNLPPDRSHIDTERIDPQHHDLHQLSATELVARIQEHDRHIVQALDAAAPAISAFIEDASPGFIAGGRLIYIGAGTSGRLGVLDASEAPPTFHVPPDRIIGIIAGGRDALVRSSEGLEDEADGAVAELKKLNITINDTILGIAAGGTTPFARGAISWCAQQNSGCTTGLLTCSDVAAPAGCDHRIYVPTGAEILTGSTRMKAGTATKQVLNTISTSLMILSGRVYGNLMVDLRASNDKLRDRAARIIAHICDIDRTTAFTLLDQAGNAVKTAIVMHQRNCPRDNAEALLSKHNGRLHSIID